jgi:hypothetical protein
MLIVYRFQEAPEKFKAMSTSGGDEDWVILGDNEDDVESIAARLAVCDFEIVSRNLDNDLTRPFGVIAITCHA